MQSIQVDPNRLNIQKMKQILGSKMAQRVSVTAWEVGKLNE